MSSVSESNQYSKQLQAQRDSFESERAQSRENHSEALQEKTEAYEKNIKTVKQDYQERLEKNRAAANEDVRKLKEDLYDSKGRKSLNESQVNRDKDYLAEDFKKQKSKLIEQNHHAEDRYQSSLHEKLAEADERNEEALRRQKSEFHQEHKEAGNETVLVQKNYENKLKGAELQNQRAAEVLATNHAHDKTQALEAQGATYQEFLHSTEVRNAYEAAQKEQELHTLKTSSDPLNLPPAAIQKIRDEAEVRNDRILKEEQKTSAENLGATRKRDIDERSAIKNDYDRKFTDSTRAKQKNSDVYSKQFEGSYVLLQEKARDDRQQLQASQKVNTEQLHAKHEQELQLQEQRSKEQMDSQRETQVHDAHSVRDESEMKEHLQDRTWAGKLNDTRRDYEKKITDAQATHETAMTDLKYEYDKKLRDQDRKSTRLMDERVKSYDYQIKQQEVAFKEKERFLTELYQEELDKVKSNNARLISKKS
jgi:hypothetical protein